jgi:hypothetical protein
MLEVQHYPSRMLFPKRDAGPACTYDAAICAENPFALIRYRRDINLALMHSLLASILLIIPTFELQCNMTTWIP